MPESLFEPSPETFDAPASIVAAASVVVPAGIAHRVETLAGVPVTVDVLTGESGSVIGFGVAARGALGLVGPGLLRYLPQRGFVGVDHFSVTLGDSDSDGDSDGSDGGRVLWVEVQVWAVNTPPLAAADLVLVEGDGPVMIDVMANDRDPDGDALEITGFGMPAHGWLQVNPDQTFTYWPDAGFLLPDHSGGHDSFRYTIRDLRGEGDGQVGFAEALVTLMRPPVVVPPNIPPIAGGDRATTSRNTEVTIAILGNDLDPDEASDAALPLRVAALTLPQHGLVRLNPDRTVTYTPDTDFTGIDDFTYVIEDERGDQSSAAAVIEVVA